MIVNLTDEKLVSNNHNAYITLDKFRRALEIIASDICQYKGDDVCLLGIARGGLPLMTGVSHFSGIRDVTSIQIQMNKSDKQNDYGQAFVRDASFNDKFDKYILFEDIVYKGQSINHVANILKEKGKEVLAIYSLVMDDNFVNDSVFKHEDIPIKYVYGITKDDWVYFPWEKGFGD
jgi:hypoxanthine phosphoribosyltransferase